MKNKHINEIVWGSISIAITLLILSYTFFSERGLIKSRVLSMERDVIVLKANDVEADNRMLSTEIESLRSDKRSIEKAARTELYMLREDEILYKFNK